jgi:phosphatidate cytidylyltransferase
MLMAIAVAVTLYYLDFFPPFSNSETTNICNYIAMAVLLHITGVYGDLIESQWKRHYGVKDSGNIIPGHGGLLDRFDSALIAIPMGVIYLVVANVLHI